MIFWKAIYPCLLAAILAAGFIKIMIPYLKKQQFGQYIREEGPESHLKKQGTPTMGGLAIYAAVLLTVAISGHYTWDVLVIAVVMTLFGLIGFLDDFIKVAKRHNLGLRAWQKLILQITFGIGLGIYIAETSDYGTSIWVPFYSGYLDIGLGYVPFVTFVIVAMANAVNLTDGLDGLSSGVTAIVCLTLGAIAYDFGFGDVSIFAYALVGGCLGFLIWNRYPARIFMGDTGSMALGGGVAAVAIMIKGELLLPIAGFIYVIEALSVIIQVFWYRKTKKRVFRMAPIHHHFEMGGMEEKSVVLCFWGVTVLVCMAAFLITLI